MGGGAGVFCATGLSANDFVDDTRDMGEFGLEILRKPPIEEEGEGRYAPPPGSTGVIFLQPD